MKVAMIGLGRVGANMAQRLMLGGHQVVGFDPKPDARRDLEVKGAETANQLAGLVANMPAPRTLWLMVPAGEITDATLTALLPLLSANDTVVDGGNSPWEYPRKASDGDQVDLVEVIEIKDGKINHHSTYWGWKGCMLIAPSLSQT